MRYLFTNYSPRMIEILNENGVVCSSSLWNGKYPPDYREMMYGIDCIVHVSTPHQMDIFGVAQVLGIRQVCLSSMEYIAGHMERYESLFMMLLDHKHQFPDPENNMERIAEYSGDTDRLILKAMRLMKRNFFEAR